MSSSKIDWESVKIPKPLVEKAQRLLEDHGYTSLNEFVRDALREKIAELERSGRLQRLEKARRVLIDVDSDAEVEEVKE